MQPYLEAHDAFVKLLDGAAECDPTAEEVEHALRGLARCAAERGMTDLHWTFVVDGLVAHAKKALSGKFTASEYVARGLTFSSRWDDLKVRNVMDGSQEDLERLDNATRYARRMR